MGKVLRLYGIGRVFESRGGIITFYYIWWQQFLVIFLRINWPNFVHFVGEYSPQNCKNFVFLPEICTSGATRLNKHPSYKHFPAVGAFSHKFSMAPSGETTDRIKKVWGAKMGRTSSITMQSMVGIMGHAPAVDEKVSCFFLSVCFLSRFEMTKFVITETLWCSISFKTIMVSLHRGRFVVVRRCSSFPIDPNNFSRGANFYQKLPFLKPYGHILKATTVKFGMRVRSWGSLPQAKFCKKMT